MDPEFFIFWLPAIVAVVISTLGLFILLKGLYFGYLFIKIMILDRDSRFQHTSLSDLVEYTLRRFMYTELPIAVKNGDTTEVVFVPWMIPCFRGDGSIKQMRKTIRGMEAIREVIGDQKIDFGDSSYYISVLQDGGLPFIEVNQKRHDYVAISTEGEVSKTTMKEYVHFLATEEGRVINSSLFILQSALCDRTPRNMDRMTTISDALNELYSHGVVVKIRGQYILISKFSKPVCQLVLRNILIDGEEHARL